MAYVNKYQELGLTREQVEEGLRLLQEGYTIRRKGELVEMPPQVVQEGDRYQSAAMHLAEVGIAGRLQAMLAAAKSKPALVVPADAFGSLVPDASQRAAVEAAAASGVLVLTGGPGVGKTTVAKAVIAVYRAAGLVVVGCAPTGKAAMRMREQTQLAASTIHSLLGSSRKFGQAPQIEADVVVIDESSMIDVELFARTVLAIREGARLLIIGDVDQLPSIGPGRVLFDLIESGALPVVRLTKIHRQASESRIPYVARDINEGRLPDLSAIEGSDFNHWETVSDPEGAAMRAVRAMVEAIPQKFGFAVEQIQILAAQRKGPCGIVQLNRMVQERLNPFDAKRPELLLGGGDDESRYTGRTGDRVLHTKNNYDLEVFNGEIGHILTLDPRGLTLEDFAEGGEYTVSWSWTAEEEEAHLLLLEEADGDEDGLPPHPQMKRENGVWGWMTPRVLVVDFGDRRLAYTAEEARQLELGYAITIHKSQGSQFDAAIVLLPAQFDRMITRPLLYTALTRAAKRALTIGSTQEMQRAIGNLRGVGRRTTLRDRMAAPVAETVTASSLGSV